MQPLREAVRVDCFDNINTQSLEGQQAHPACVAGQRQNETVPVAEHWGKLEGRLRERHACPFAVLL